MIIAVRLFNVGHISEEIAGGSLSPSCFGLKSTVFAIQVWCIQFQQEVVCYVGSRFGRK